MSGYYHFEPENFESHAKRISDEERGMVRDNTVGGCVDCVIINNGQMLLGKRIHEPHPDWWIIGGKMIPGESPKKAIARKLREELNLKIEDSRFHFFCIGSFVWPKRAEPPQENGCHDLSLVMILKISDEEVEKIKPNAEYEKVDWFDPEVVMENEDFHPAVVAFANEVIVHLKRQG